MTKQPATELPSELAARRRVAMRIAELFSQHPLITSVLVFGSVASGTADAYSDIDLFVVCRPQIVPAVQRAAILDELDDGWVVDHPSDNRLFATLDEGGHVEGIGVSVHYQSVAWIDAVLHEVLDKGAMTTERLPFRAYTLPALLERAWLLVDKEQRVAGWRARLQPYPPPLQRNILQHFTPILQEQTDDMVLAARRGIGPKVFLFHLDRAADALVSILYALNEVYDPADKRAEQTVWPRLKDVPAGFVPRLATILAGPFDRTGMVQQAQRFAELASEVLAQAQRSAG